MVYSFASACSICSVRGNSRHREFWVSEGRWGGWDSQSTYPSLLDLMPKGTGCGPQPEMSTWRGVRVKEVQNVLRSAWIKTDAARKTANAMSVETRMLAASGFYPRAARHILYPLYPPSRWPSSPIVTYCVISAYGSRRGSSAGELSRSKSRAKKR